MTEEQIALPTLQDNTAIVGAEKKTRRSILPWTPYLNAHEQ